ELLSRSKGTPLTLSWCTSSRHWCPRVRGNRNGPSLHPTLWGGCQGILGGLVEGGAIGRSYDPFDQPLGNLLPYPSESPMCRIGVGLRPRSRPKVVRGRGAAPGVSMSGHVRLCLAALLFAALSTSPAASNPFDVWFSSSFDAWFKSTPVQATAPDPAED